MIFVGDLHGNFKYLETILNGYSNHEHIIQVGDFGIGFKSPLIEYGRLSRLQDILAANKQQLYIIRGNHDDPAYWSLNDKFHTSDFINIHFMRDYTILQIEGNNVLFIGGAISIDRRHRVKDRDYWEDEGFAFESEEKIYDLLSDWDRIDVVVTHTTPSCAFPTKFGSLVYSFHENDANLLTDLKVERHLITRVRDILNEKHKPQLWVYGHFHDSKTEYIDGTKFVLLDIGEAYYAKEIEKPLEN